MTEIPEHLLKKAAAARAARAGDDAPADDAAPAATDAPAAAPSAAVEKTKAAPAPLPTLDEETPKVVVDIPVVAAAKARKRVPYWAASVLAVLPLWGVIYLFSVQPPPAGESDPFVIGEEVYIANCAGCHLPSGAGSAAGGTGQQLNEGVPLATFADPLAMAYWIHYGAAAGGARPDGTYGDLTRPGGPHSLNTLPSAAMPGFPDLPPEELAAVIIYIRRTVRG